MHHSSRAAAAVAGAASDLSGPFTSSLALLGRDLAREKARAAARALPSSESGDATGTHDTPAISVDDEFDSDSSNPDAIFEENGDSSEADISGDDDEGWSPEYLADARAASIKLFARGAANRLSGPVLSTSTDATPAVPPLHTTTGSVPVSVPIPASLLSRRRGALYGEDGIRQRILASQRGTNSPVLHPRQSSTKVEYEPSPAKSFNDSSLEGRRPGHRGRPDHGHRPASTHGSKF